jgi:hydrogenase-4 component E
MMAIIIVLFLLTLVRFAAATRLETCVMMTGVQGFLLFLIPFSCSGSHTVVAIVLLGLETILVKGIILPLVLLHMLRKNRVYRDVEPFIPQLSSLVMVVLIILAGFFVAIEVNEFGGDVQQLLFAAAVSTFLLALFIIITRRKLITHVIGFVLFENGAFLLSLSLFQEMPAVVQLGVLLDAFVAVFLFGIFIKKVSSNFDNLDAWHLTTLKD